MIVLKTNYDKNTDNAWMIKENVSREAESIRYNTNRGHFAKFKLSFEVYDNLEPVVLENLAELQEDMKGNARFEKSFDLYTKRILITIEEYFNEMYLSGYPTINLKIVLSDLIIEDFSSSERAYQVATESLLTDLFKSDILIPSYKL